MRKNIAILMSPDADGNTKTNICELACALSRGGSSVTVFSSGGDYVPRLELGGIKHICTPFESGSPSSYSTCKRLLCDFVKANRPCVIHSHDRVCERAAAAVSKKLSVPYVSTVHDTKKAPLFSKLGSYVLATSERAQLYATDVLKTDISHIRFSFDTARAAEDALLAYELAEADIHPYGVMLCGYYGRHNLGDDMSLKALAINLSKVCGVDKKVVITTDATATPTDDGTVFIHRFNLPKIYKYMKQSKMFILGSGSILQDATSSRSMVYYLHVLKKALSLCQRTMLYSNGIGPIHRTKHRQKATLLLNKVMRIVVRDKKSLEYLREMGVRNPAVELAADETFTMEKNLFLREYPLENSKKYLGINLRYLNIDEQFISEFAKFIDFAAKKYSLTPLLLPVQYEQDIPVLKRVSDKLKCDHVLITQKLEHEKTLSILSQCEVSVLERLHAIIFTSIFGKPYLAIDYDPKVRSLCNELGVKQYMIGLGEFSAKTASEMFSDIMQNKDEIVNMLQKTVATKRELALLNAKAAKELLEE